MTLPDHITSTRRVYDHSAEAYVTHLGTELSERFETEQDRSTLDALAESVRAAGGGRVLDVGCGPGRATAYLARAGLDVSGIDLSQAMVAVAQTAHPELSFRVGSLTELGVPDHSLAAAVYWYSIIHTPLERLAGAWAELNRALSPGGHALLALQSGDNTRIDRPDAYGSSTMLTRYHHKVQSICDSLESAGFRILTRVEREAELPHEQTSQAMVTVRGPL